MLLFLLVFFYSYPHPLNWFAPADLIWQGSGPNNSIRNNNNNNIILYLYVVYKVLEVFLSLSLSQYLNISLARDQQVRHGVVGISIVKDDFTGHVWPHIGIYKYIIYR